MHLAESLQERGDSSKGKPYWKIAEDFIRKVSISEHEEIVYSGVILRELQIKLKTRNYENIKKLLEEFRKINVLQDDKRKARKLESDYGFSISFYDLVHLSIAKRLNFILITRDKELIKIAKENEVEAKGPEEIS